MKFNATSMTATYILNIAVTEGGKCGHRVVSDNLEVTTVKAIHNRQVKRHGEWCEEPQSIHIEIRNASPAQREWLIKGVQLQVTGELVIDSYLRQDGTYGTYVYIDCHQSDVNVLHVPDAARELIDQVRAQRQPKSASSVKAATVAEKQPAYDDIPF
jgi:single-stranded DNA-binding protein